MTTRYEDSTEVDNEFQEVDTSAEMRAAVDAGLTSTLFGDTLPSTSSADVTSVDVVSSSDDGGVARTPQEILSKLPDSETSHSIFSKEWQALEVDNCFNFGDQAYICRIDPFIIRTDPDAFQYKAAVKEGGVTGILDGVKEWNNDLSGIAFVWISEEGVPFIVDGHQRLDVAKRKKRQALAEGDIDKADNIYITAKVWKHTDFKNDDGTPMSTKQQKKEMRVRAAVKNVADEKGTPVDAANVIKEHGIKYFSEFIGSNSAVYKQGVVLSLLDERAYNDAVYALNTQQLNPSALMGISAETKPELHSIIIDYLIREYAKKGEVSTVKARDIAETIKHTARLRDAKKMQLTLYDAGLDTLSNNPLMASMDEFSRLRVGVVNKLKGNKNVFTTLNENEDLVAEVGNQINVDANAAIIEDSQRAEALLNKLSHSSPLIDYLGREAVKIAAKRERNNMPLQRAVDSELGRITDELLTYLSVWDKGGKIRLQEEVGNWFEEQTERVISEEKIPEKKIEEGYIKVSKQIKSLEKKHNGDLDAMIDDVTKMVKRYKDTYTEQYNTARDISDLAERNKIMDYANDSGALANAWAEYRTSLWLQKDPQHIQDRTPNYIPEALAGYKDVIPNAIGLVKNWENVVSAVNEIGKYDDKIEQFGIESLSTNEMNDYLSHTVTAINGLKESTHPDSSNILLILQQESHKIRDVFTEKDRKEKIEKAIASLPELENKIIEAESFIVTADFDDFINRKELKDIRNKLAELADNMVAIRGQTSQPDWADANEKYTSLMQRIYDIEKKVEDGILPWYVYEEQKTRRERETNTSTQEDGTDTKRRGKRKGIKTTDMLWSPDPSQERDPKSFGYATQNIGAALYQADIANAKVKVLEARLIILRNAIELSDEEAINVAQNQLNEAERELRERLVAAQLPVDEELPDYGVAVDEAIKKSRWSINKLTTMINQGKNNPYKPWHDVLRGEIQRLQSTIDSYPDLQVTPPPVRETYKALSRESGNVKVQQQMSRVVESLEKLHESNTLKEIIEAHEQLRNKLNKGDEQFHNPEKVIESIRRNATSYVDRIIENGELNRPAIKIIELAERSANEINEWEEAVISGEKDIPGLSEIERYELVDFLQKYRGESNVSDSTAGVTDGIDTITDTDGIDADSSDLRSDAIMPPKDGEYGSNQEREYLPEIYDAYAKLKNATTYDEFVEASKELEELLKKANRIVERKIAFKDKAKTVRTPWSTRMKQVLDDVGEQKENISDNWADISTIDTSYGDTPVHGQSNTLDKMSSRLKQADEVNEVVNIVSEMGKTITVEKLKGLDTNEYEALLEEYTQKLVRGDYHKDKTNEVIEDTDKTDSSPRETTGRQSTGRSSKNNEGRRGSSRTSDSSGSRGVQSASAPEIPLQAQLDFGGTGGMQPTIPASMRNVVRGSRPRPAGRRRR